VYNFWKTYQEELSMKVMLLLKTIALTVLLSASLAAEESDPAVKCDLAHDACIEKCDRSADGSTACYDLCEGAYTKCLAIAQGEEPEPEPEPEQVQIQEQIQEPEQKQAPEQTEGQVQETEQK
jgi:hypothetical protein